jgi:hypothetical protein
MSEQVKTIEFAGKQVETIDCTPTWRWAMSVYILAIAQKGMNAKDAIADLERLADNVDAKHKQEMEEIKKLQTMADNQERLLLNLREIAERKRLTFSNNALYDYERAKFIGMIEAMRTLGMDVEPYNWINL